MNLTTNYKEVKNEEKNGIELYFDAIPTKEERDELKSNGYRWHNVKKCWYISIILNTSKPAAKETTLKLKSIRPATAEEVEKIAVEQWESPKMQEFVKTNYDFYMLADGNYIEFEKVSKFSIQKTMYYNDEYDAPEKSFENFKNYNLRYNSGELKDLDEYLENVESLKNGRGARGCYDYDGLYIWNNSTRENKVTVSCQNAAYFNTTVIRYLTADEQEDYIAIIKDRKEKYIERLAKYFKRYGQHISTYGYWANR